MPIDKKVTTTQEYFATLKDRFIASEAGGVNASFMYELGDEVWHAVIKDGVLVDVGQGPIDKPTLVINMKPDQFLEMSNGDLDGAKAFMTRKLKVKGNVAMAQKMKKFLPAFGG